MMQGTTNIKCH